MVGAVATVDGAGELWGAGGCWAEFRIGPLGRGSGLDDARLEDEVVEVEKGVNDDESGVGTGTVSVGCGCDAAAEGVSPLAGAPAVTSYNDTPWTFSIGAQIFVG